MTRNLLTIVRPLYDAGWALHWLMPREKRPLNSGWTSGERTDWRVLSAQYRPGLNVGVRLGRASAIEGGFLACLDCDMKSAEPRHLEEFEARLFDLFPELVYSGTPVVTSGRGNGSRHIYGRTSQPVLQRVLARSPDSVRVMMPSAKPSKNDLANLSGTEIEAGYRMRPAWEITLMSEGRQMVLPPSIHPDSGAPYVWSVQPGSEYFCFDRAENMEAISSGAKSPGGKLLDFKWEPVLVDLDKDPRATDKLRALCRDASGYDDQSKALFKACIDLNRARFTDDEILTVLTDPNTVLGCVAYRHTQRPVMEKNRRAAAFWLARYTLARVKASLSIEAEFDGEAVTAALPEAEAAKQEAELLEESWEMTLERGGQNGSGRIKATLLNLVTILENAVSPTVFRRDQFAGYEVFGSAVPEEWGRREIGQEITDADLKNIKVWFSVKFKFEPPLALIDEAISVIAEKQKFHPVRDYINALEWDGEPRIDGWLKKYAGATGEEAYLSAVSRKTLVAMVARVYRPGVKFDNVLILEGKQGVGKSTLVRVLASDDWFSDNYIDIKNKDAILNIRGVWGLELGELSSMRKADVDHLKEFISRTFDRMRVPYGRRVEKFSRQCVFIGTTNSSEYFTDPTGNRRFWPVAVGECDFKGLAAVRDQLFAEAKVYFDLGEKLWLDEKEAAAGAATEQDARFIDDAWSELFREHFKEVDPKYFNPEQFTMRELFGDHGPLAGTNMSKHEQFRAGSVLRRMGFTRKTGRIGKILTKIWSRPNSSLVTEETKK